MYYALNYLITHPLYDVVFAYNVLLIPNFICMLKRLKNVSKIVLYGHNCNQ